MLFSHFFLALVIGLIFGKSNSYLFSIVLKPGVILSGIGAQLTAYYFSKGFMLMNVKGVVTSSKIADLLIPFILFLCGQSFFLSNYIFSLLSTLIFYPIFKASFSKELLVNWRIIWQLLLCLCFQAAINYYFQISSLAIGWDSFLSLMAAILFWRLVYIIGVTTLQGKNPLFKRTSFSLQLYIFLFLRALLAFVSQAAFFYSITRVNSFIAWPVLNAGPLFSCYIAHLFLKETMSINEKKVAGYFLLISAFYLYFNRSLLL